MNILIDEAIPCAQMLFANFGKVSTFSGRNLTSSKLQFADVLLVRSVTKVNRQLLNKANRLQIVGTATIGTDHLDIDYLNQQNISYINAPGCNRFAVAEYVLSSLLYLSKAFNFELPDKSIALIGAGHTGTAVLNKLKALGVTTYLCDPPLMRSGDPRSFIALEQALQADIISLHIPLTVTGQEPTYHLLNQARLTNLLDTQILINTSRGAVIDQAALLKLKQLNRGPYLVLDVWQNEPNISRELVKQVTLATPHIAGYSVDGRIRGSYQLYLQLAKFFNCNADIAFNPLLPPSSIKDVTLEPLTTRQCWQFLQSLIYNVKRDDRKFRQYGLTCSGFDRLRKVYWQRRESSALTVHTQQPELIMLLSKLGFTIDSQSSYFNS